jgi:hypothetical protein
MRVLGSLISPTALGELIERDWDLAAPVTCKVANHNVNDQRASCRQDRRCSPGRA